MQFFRAGLLGHLVGEDLEPFVGRALREHVLDAELGRAEVDRLGCPIVFFQPTQDEGALLTAPGPVERLCPDAAPYLGVGGPVASATSPDVVISRSSRSSRCMTSG